MNLTIIVSNYNKYYINNNKLEQINFYKDNCTHIISSKSILSLLKQSLSKDRYLTKEGKYDIYLDINNYKHYFENGIENIELFFVNNGKDCTAYSNILNSKLIKDKMYRILISGVTITLIANLSFFQSIEKTNVNEIAASPQIVEKIEPVTTNEILNSIANSNMDHELKEKLLNSEFIDFALQYWNDDYLLRKRISGINVEYFDNQDNLSVSANGYYKITNPNTLFIYKNCINPAEVICHEFAHLMQADLIYSYLIESTAEIFSNEFYNNPITAYNTSTIRCIKLAKLIGTEPILNCVFNGNDTYIREELSNYLSDSEKINLLNLLKESPAYCENIEELNKQIDYYINMIFERKYGDNKEAEILFAAIDKSQNLGRISTFNKNNQKKILCSTSEVPADNKYIATYVNITPKAKLITEEYEKMSVLDGEVMTIMYEDNEYSVEEAINLGLIDSEYNCLLDNIIFKRSEKYKTIIFNIDEELTLEEALKKGIVSMPENITQKTINLNEFNINDYDGNIDLDYIFYSKEYKYIELPPQVDVKDKVIQIQFTGYTKDLENKIKSSKTM